MAMVVHFDEWELEEQDLRECANDQCLISITEA